MKATLLVLLVGAFLFKYGSLAIDLCLRFAGFLITVGAAVVVHRGLAESFLESGPFRGHPALAEAAALLVVVAGAVLLLRFVFVRVGGRRIGGAGAVGLDILRIGLAVALVCLVVVTVAGVLVGAALPLSWLVLVPVAAIAAGLDVAFPQVLDSMASMSVLRRKNHRKEKLMTSDRESGRAWLGPLVLGTVILLVLIWIMGDHLVPFVKTAKAQALDKIESLVDRAELEYTRALEKYEAAKAAMPEVAAKTAKAEILFREQQRKFAAAEAVVRTHEARLTYVKTCLEDGTPVRTVSGRDIARPEIEAFVNNSGRGLELARRKIGFHEAQCEKRESEVERLRAQSQEIPQKLRNLQAGLAYLEDKRDFYREVRDELVEMDDETTDFLGIAEEAERALEQAHLVLDVGIAEVEARLQCGRTADELIIDMGAQGDDDLLATINGYLGASARGSDELAVR